MQHGGALSLPKRSTTLLARHSHGGSPRAVSECHGEASADSSAAHNSLTLKVAVGRVPMQTPTRQRMRRRELVIRRLTPGDAAQPPGFPFWKIRGVNRAM